MLPTRSPPCPNLYQVLSIMDPFFSTFLLKNHPFASSRPYLAVNSLAHKASCSLPNLLTHLHSKAWFLSWSGTRNNPPLDFGLVTSDHATKWTFFFVSLSPQRNLRKIHSIFLATPLGISKWKVVGGKIHQDWFDMGNPTTERERLPTPTCQSSLDFLYNRGPEFFMLRVPTYRKSQINERKLSYTTADYFCKILKTVLIHIYPNNGVFSDLTPIQNIWGSPWNPRALGYPAHRRTGYHRQTISGWQ